MRGTEIQVFFAETFGLRHLEIMLCEAFMPIGQRIFGYGQAHEADLPAAFLGLHADVGHRECGEQRTLFTDVVPVVQVVNRRGPVVEQGALDAFQAQHLGVKIEVFLHVADSDRNMVMTGQACAWQIIGHDGSPM